MILLKSNLGWAVVCSLILSCSTSMKTLILPQGTDNNFRSGELQHPVFKGNRVRVLEYQVFSDSILNSAYNDTVLTFGIIFPRSAMVIKATENKMVFGTDSMQFDIWYTTKSFQSESQQNSILTAIILKPDKNDPNYDPYQKRITPYKKILSGIIQYPLLKGEVQFQFEHEKAKKNFDSAQIKGYLSSGNDSFFIKPLYREELLRGKNVKPMQVLQGYCLMKGDSLYAFLQHAPMVKTLYRPTLKDVLFLNTKTSQAEQMLFAAYFTLVSRLVETTAQETLY